MGLIKSRLLEILQKEATARVVLVISLIVTAVGWRIASTYVEKRSADRFAFAVQDATDRIVKRMLEYEQVLRSGVSFFQTHGGKVTRSQWHQYVEGLLIDKYYPGIQGMGFSRIIHPKDLNKHIASIRAEGFNNYRVYPEYPRDIYTAIVYLEPFDWRNQRAFGYDMYSNPMRRKAMDMARDSGNAAISGKVILVQETDKDIQAGFLMYLPLYDTRLPVSTPEERARAIRGYVYSPFRIKDLLNGILGTSLPSVQFSLYDGNEEHNKDLLLYSSYKKNADTSAYQPKHTEWNSIHLQGRDWWVRFNSTKDFDVAMGSSQPEIIAIGGILVDMLLYIVIASLAGEKKRVLRKAEEMTISLKENTSRLTLAQDATQTGIWDYNIATDTLVWDRRMYDIYGLDKNRFGGTAESWLQTIHPDDRENIQNKFNLALKGSGDHFMEYRIIKPNGKQIYIESSAVAIKDENNRIERMIGVNRDITEVKLRDEHLQLAANVFQYSQEGILVTDANSVILDANPSFSAITGWTKEEVLGQNPRILKSGRHDKEFYQNMWHSLTTKGHWKGEIWNRKKNGESYVEYLTISVLNNAKGERSHYVAVFSDITHIKEQQSRLEQLAKFDPLTKLANRVLLADRMDMAIAHARRDGTLLAVCYLDLDHFKNVNDSHGHHLGDELLIQVSQRIKKNIRETDTAARLGGDEFVLLLGELNNLEECYETMRRLKTDLTQPYELSEEKNVYIAASIGITLYPLDDSDSDTLLRHADQAMYVAKQSGRNRYQLFDLESDRITLERTEKIENIKTALEKGEFVLYYQPRVNMRKGEIIGAEALIRWNHPTKGVLEPIEFLPIIEKHALLVEVGEWVNSEVIKQMSVWKKEGYHIPVSINIAGSHLQHENFLPGLKKMLEQHKDIPGEMIELEILENTTLEDTLLVSKVINECRELGIRVALDDFGTGYSSLTYLKRLPVDTLKIDQTFVRDLLEDPEDLAIIEGVIGLSNAFNRVVIAEGVESVEHGNLLLRLGCDYGQGFGIARPMPAGDLTEWIRNYEQPGSWKNISSTHHLSTALLPLYRAEIEHRRWVNDLIFCVSDSNEDCQLPEMDYNKCKFSHWFYSQEVEPYGHLPAYKSIEQSHKEIHQLGQELVELFKSGKRNETIQSIDKLRDHRNHLQELLTILHNEIINNNNEKK